jgi:hypothetical protein
LVEHTTENRGVAGSIPALATSMRRAFVLLALVASCLCAAGCGGGHDNASSPLDDAVGYFAKDAPFVAAIQTDSNNPQVKQLQPILGSFLGPALATRVANSAGVRSFDYDKDVRPQLGAPLVIGLTRPAAGSGLGTVTVVAMRIKHPLRVKQVLLRQQSIRGHGKESGVRIFEDPIDSRYYAVDGHMLVAASDRAILAQALAIRRTDNRMRAHDFYADLKGLPANGLIRISADPRSEIGADPRLRPALGLKWLSAMHRLGAVVSAAPGGLTLDFHVATDRSQLRDSDLPLAPKSGPLPLVGGQGEVRAGLREPGRLTRFALAVWRAVAPHSLQHLRQLEPAGVDLEQQLPHHLGDAAVLAFNPFTKEFEARVGLRQPADVKASLSSLAPVLPDLAAALGMRGLGVAAPQPGENFYALAKTNGRTAVFGVVGSSLVAASQAQRAAGLASEATHNAPHGVRGAAVITLDAKQIGTELIRRRLQGAAGFLAPLALANVRDLTGALTINRSGLDGRFKLTVAG